MRGKRIDRMGSLIQMELSRLILTRVKDPRLGFVTVTHVEVNPDMKSARVFYSALGDKKARSDSQFALEHSAGFLQKEIGTTLKLRFTPRLQFVYDDSLDRGLEIDRVLRNIQDQEKQN